jgi:hypothetical protein
MTAIKSKSKGSTPNGRILRFNRWRSNAPTWYKVFSGGLNVAMLMFVFVVTANILHGIHPSLTPMASFLWLYMVVSAQDAKRGKINIITFIPFALFWYMFASAGALFVALISTLTLGYLIKTWLSRRGLKLPMFTLGLGDVIGVPIVFVGIAWLGTWILLLGSLVFAALMLFRIVRLERRVRLGITPAREARIRLLPVCFFALVVCCLCALIVPSLIL